VKLITFYVLHGLIFSIGHINIQISSKFTNLSYIFN